MNRKTSLITQAALIAAIYVVLTLIARPFSFGEVQVRISEALTVLPFFTPAAIPGLFIGCLLANFLGGAIVFDVIFGSLATLIAASLSYLLRKKRWLVPLPPVLVNSVVVGIILRYAYQVPMALPLIMLFVGIGQLISCYGLGYLLMLGLEPYKYKLFK